MRAPRILRFSSMEIAQAGSGGSAHPSRGASTVQRLDGDVEEITRALEPPELEGVEPTRPTPPFETFRPEDRGGQCEEDQGAHVLSFQIGRGLEHLFTRIDHLRVDFVGPLGRNQ